MAKQAPIILRDYGADDLDAVIDIFRSAVRDVASRDYSPAQIEAWATVDRSGWSKARLASPTWLAVVDGRAAGFSDLTKDGLLDMMFVHADFQGQGIATALLARSLDEARSRGLTSIRTEASLTARGFFERNGFELVARQEVKKRGQLMVNFRMRRPVA